MTVLNITYNGMSADYPMDANYKLNDQDVRRIATELVQGGGLRGMHYSNLPRNAFRHYVVDRFTAPNGDKRIYLRPKVPFGAQPGVSQRG